MSTPNSADARNCYSRMLSTLKTVIKGNDRALKLVLAGFAAGGHILLEDNPGTGKTTLAKTLAQSTDTSFKRIQFTPDLLPSDILGVSIFDPREAVFRLHKGPIFSNILLADEINRASPRTQSALLEAMAEKQVSIDGRQMYLDDLFFVIATQNPVEFRGTYPLPEAQMDRFSMQFGLGYIAPEDEVAVMKDQETRHPVETIEPSVTTDDIKNLKDQVLAIHISEELKGYIVALTGATRTANGVLLGASPRASVSLMNISKALALFAGSDFVTPDYIQDVAVEVIAHRLVIDPQAEFSGVTRRSVVEGILGTVTVPV